jgi:hypothetical protein
VPRRGFTHKEVLLGLLVLLVGAAIVYEVAISLAAKQSMRGDVENMRKLYLSLALYEGDENGWMAPDLLAARDRVPDDGCYLSDKDPYLKASGPFPIDGGLPQSLGAPVRISYAYLFAHERAKGLKLKPWYELKFDPTIGFLADEWRGSVKPLGAFDAEVTGMLFRLNTDGALHVLERRQRMLGDENALFLKP